MLHQVACFIQADILRFAVVFIQTERLIGADFAAGQVNVFGCRRITEDNTGEKVLFCDLTHCVAPCSMVSVTSNNLQSL